MPCWLISSRVTVVIGRACSTSMRLIREPVTVSRSRVLTWSSGSVSGVAVVCWAIAGIESTAAMAIHRQRALQVLDAFIGSLPGRWWGAQSNPDRARRGGVQPGQGGTGMRGLAEGLDLAGGGLDRPAAT